MVASTCVPADQKKEKKRLQNRSAQQNYRERQAARIKRLENCIDTLKGNDNSGLIQEHFQVVDENKKLRGVLNDMQRRVCSLSKEMIAAMNVEQRLSHMYEQMTPQTQSPTSQSSSASACSQESPFSAGHMHITDMVTCFEEKVRAAVEALSPSATQHEVFPILVSQELTPVLAQIPILALHRGALHNLVSVLCWKIFGDEFALEQMPLEYSWTLVQANINHHPAIDYLHWSDVRDAAILNRDKYDIAAFIVAVIQNLVVELDSLGCSMLVSDALSVICEPSSTGNTVFGADFRETLKYCYLHLHLKWKLTQEITQSFAFLKHTSAISKLPCLPLKDFANVDAMMSAQNPALGDRYEQMPHDLPQFLNRNGCDQG